MNLITQDPWATVQRLQDEIGRIFPQSRGLRVGQNDNSDVVTSNWTPAVDIKEETDRFLITADIPGVAPEEIEVTMEDGVLTIRGERDEENRNTEDGYRRSERVSGTFYRRFSLPDGVDPERVSAEGKHGVLQVVIPKVEKVKPRRIDVSIQQS